MYLKRLELQGFKSFADKTILEFKPGITSVIGPNGSGKSNISDAIRWVLGEQSMKSLRGAKSEDIIFAGTQERKSLGFAEVSIVIDNSDAKLPIEYAEVTVTRKIYRNGETGYFINKTPCRLKDNLQTNYSEVSIKRVMYRTGENEYFLNNEHCRLKDITSLFIDSGADKEAFNIISQGKIDEILSNKSEDRRHIFEEAAGIVKYRTRKQESEKKMEQTKLNLLRINDILTEIEGNIEPLKAQSEKAKQYLNLREELKNIEVGLFVYNINSYKEKLKQIVQDEEIMVAQKETEDEKLTSIQELKDSLKREIDEIILQIEQMQNIGFESSNKIEKMNSEIGISKERIQNNLNNKERLQIEIQEFETRIKELEEEEKQRQEKKANLFQNKEKFEAELKQKEEELSKLTKNLSEKELEIEEKKQKIEGNTDKKYEVLADISAQEANYENLEKRKKAIKLELENIISELDSTRDNKQEVSKGFYEIQNKRNIANDNLEQEKNKKQESMNKIKEYEEEISRLNYQINMKDARHKFLQETEKEKEGYIKSVKTLLQECEKNSQLKKGVYGVFANLISVDKNYETAIEMCLGQSLQNIVTETEEEAKKLII